MSVLTFVDQKRNGSVIRENIFVQIDETDGTMTSYIGGAAPKFDHWIYVTGAFDVQIKDQFTDRNLDVRGARNTYRVSKLPEAFGMACMEIGAELIAGT